MTDKEKIKVEIERLKECGCASPIVVCDTLLAFIDSLQEESVNIWHDASEKPEHEDLVIETNDGRLIHRQSINNYGMVKRWAYASDLLNLDNSCNFGKNLQEDPKENTSNELKVAADNALESISDKYDIISVASCLEMFRLGTHWKEQQMMGNAVDGRFSYNPNFKENEFICLEKSDTPEHYLGELVKVIIIKQEEE